MDSRIDRYFYTSNRSGRVLKEDIYLNNFYRASFVADDNFTYTTVEHYFQCHKFDNFDEQPEFKAIFDEIRKVNTPFASKRLAWKYCSKYDETWIKEKWYTGYRDTIMKQALIRKFSQNLNLLEKLASTGTDRLIEDSKDDYYWGGALENSKNRLGDLLMELRDNYVKTSQVFIDGSGLEPIYIKI